MRLTRSSRSSAVITESSNDKKAAMQAILAKYGPKALMKAQGLEATKDGVTGGPIASQGMAEIRANIMAIEDPTERAIALLNAAKRNGVSLEDYGASVENRKERNRLLVSAAKISNDVELTEEQQQEKLRQLADENGVSLEQLQKAQDDMNKEIDRRTQAVKARLNGEKDRNDREKKEEENWQQQRRRTTERHCLNTCCVFS